MNRDQLVDRCKAIIREAYDEATEMIVAYLELNPDEATATLCKEIDPENWNALRNRIDRAKARRKANAGAELSGSRTNRAVATRHAKSVLRTAEPEAIADLLDDPDVRLNVAAAQKVRELRTENRTGIPARNPSTGPTFIALVVKVNGWLDELVGMVEGGEAVVPDEFSTRSLTDIGVKAMRLKELVDDARDNATTASVA